MNDLRRIFKLSAIIAALGLAATTSCLATTYYVATNGSDSNNGLTNSSGGAFATIGHAATVVNPGDTVDVDAGTYSTSTTVTMLRGGSSGSPITFQTTPGQSTAIISVPSTGITGGMGSDSDIIDVGNTTTTANYIILNNLTFQGGGTDMFECVCFYNTNYSTMENCTCEYGYWGGADISNFDSGIGVSHDQFLDCVFYDNSTNNTGGTYQNWGGGVGLDNCTYSSISGCTVYDNWGEGLTGGNSNVSGGSTITNSITNNTVYDNYAVDLYLNNAQGYTVYGNLVWTDTNTYNQQGYQAVGFSVDDEGSPLYGGDPNPQENCNIYNNIVIGGAWCFRYANTIWYPGFYNVGLRNFNIYNNLFYGSTNGTIEINQDSGNNFTWRNNMTWQPNSSIAMVGFGGGGTYTLSNNCWDYSGGSNQMAGTNDYDLSNTNPGLANPGGFTAASYAPTSSTPSAYNTGGYNDSSLFTTDYNSSTRPSSGAWSIGPFVAYGSGGGGGTDLVQETDNAPATSGSSISQAFASSQTSGDLNAVIIGYNNTTATVSSVTDSEGNTYTKAIGPTVSSLGSQYIYYAPSIHSGSDTVTVNMSASVNYPDLRIAEYKNVGALDKTAGASGSSTTSSSGSATTTSANEVIVGADQSGPTVTSAGTGFGNLLVTADGDAMEDDTVTSTGSHSASFGLGSSGAWAADMATFKAASSKTNTTTSLTSSANPSTSGQSVTFTATVSPTVPNGETVTFKDSGTTIGTGTTSSNVATYSTSTLSVATHPITATYAGDANFNASTSSTVSQVVNAVTVAYKQSAFSNPTSGSTVSCTYSSTETAGDMNIIGIGSNSPTGAISSVVDSEGNTYTKAIGMTSLTGGTEQSIYYAPNIHGGASNAVTVTFTGSVGYPDLRITEFSGVTTLDKTASGTGTTGTAASTTSVTTTVAKEVLFSATDCDPITKSFGSGYTDLWPTTGDTDGNSAAYDIVSSTGSYSGTATIATSSIEDWVIDLATFH